MKKFFTKAALAAGFAALSMSSATAATPDTFYVLGEVNGQTWMYNSGTLMKKDGDKFTVAVRTNKTDSYFSFCKNLSSVSWDDLNVPGNRWGAENDGTAAVLNSPLKVTDANANAYAFKISEQGTYTFTVDFSNPSNVTLTVTEGGTPDPVTPPDPVEITEPDKLYLLGDIPGHHWEANYGVEMTKKGHVFTGTADIETAYENDYGFFSFCTVLGSASDDWNAGVNTGNRFGPTVQEEVTPGNEYVFTQYTANENASSCGSWKILPGRYEFTVDFENHKVSVEKAGGDNPAIPENLYVLGDLEGHQWEANYGAELTKGGNSFSGSFTLVAADSQTIGWFSLCTVLGDAADAWDTGVNTGNRFGPAEANTDVEFDKGMPFTLYAAGVNASACSSWQAAPGEYNIVVNFTDNTITVSKKTGVEAIETEESDAVYYNLQGVRVASPERGVYIRVAGGKASKVLLK